jgi:hypothetical protein
VEAISNVFIDEIENSYHVSVSNIISKGNDGYFEFGVFQYHFIPCTYGGKSEESESSGRGEIVAQMTKRRTTTKMTHSCPLHII